MRFALLGDHPDGLAAVHALAISGRHELVAYSGPPESRPLLERWNLRPKYVGDLEEVLADPAVDAVIVASPMAVRLAQLRRALQSERHALCVHPVAETPDAAYEASLIQAETGVVLAPLLPWTIHPAIQRLRGWLPLSAAPPRTLPPPLPRAAQISGPEQDMVMVRPDRPAASALEIEAPPWGESFHLVGPPRLIDLRVQAEEDVLLEAAGEGAQPGLPCWDLLRMLGGDIAEVQALAPDLNLDRRQPVLVTGRFLQGGLFQLSLLPDQPNSQARLTLNLVGGQVQVDFPQGFPGPATLLGADGLGQTYKESWPEFDPWLPLMAAFEEAVLTSRRHGPHAQAAPPKTSLTETPAKLGWADAWRAMELDEAVRRSVHRRRSMSLDHQEATEEASFKGAMTLVGCSLLWISLLLLILSVWLPWLGWVILPVFGIFLGMQALRWVVPEQPQPGSASPPKNPPP